MWFVSEGVRECMCGSVNQGGRQRAVSEGMRMRGRERERLVSSSTIGCANTEYINKQHTEYINKQHTEYINKQHTEYINRQHTVH